MAVVLLARHSTYRARYVKCNIAERAQQEKAVGAPKRRWDKTSFFEEVKQRTPDVLSVVEKIADWMAVVGVVSFGQGGQSGSMNLTITANRERYHPISIWTYGTIEIEFQYLMVRGTFENEIKRRELLHKLNEIKGINLSGASITKRPPIPFTVLLGEAELTKFLSVMNWMVDELRRT